MKNLVQKNVSIPDWVEVLLYENKEVCNGLGKGAAIAIVTFYLLSREEK